MRALAGRRIALLERVAAPARGSLADDLAARLRAAGAEVEVVCAETRPLRIDVLPPWDLVVLKSGTPAALHLAAAAAAWGVPCVNPVEATRLTQDKLAATALLLDAGLPVPDSRLAWLDGDAAARVRPFAGLPLVVKGQRGSRGESVFPFAEGELPRMLPLLPSGPYLLMERVPHWGDDLKVFVAGGWLRAIRRPYPALSPAEKRGRAVRVPRHAAQVAREAGRLLGLSCYGCDFVLGRDGAWLVDVNAFPGYKGADGAAAALAAVVERTAAEAL